MSVSKMSASHGDAAPKTPTRQEALDLVLQYNETASLINHAKATLEKSGSRAALEEELGDVVLSTFYLANALDVDLEAEMSAKYARLKKQFNLDI
jgi:NTP pyrophosphatase (non-canonical NTP hydrolase)